MHGGVEFSPRWARRADRVDVRASDPAMVIRYFGNKDELFAQAAHVELSLPDLRIDAGEQRLCQIGADWLTGASTRYRANGRAKSPLICPNCNHPSISTSASQFTGIFRVWPCRLMSGRERRHRAVELQYQIGITICNQRRLVETRSNIHHGEDTQPSRNPIEIANRPA